MTSSGNIGRRRRWVGLGIGVFGLVSAVAVIGIIITSVINSRLECRVAPVGDQVVQLGRTLTLDLQLTKALNCDEPVITAGPLPLPDNAAFDTSTGRFTFQPDEFQVQEFVLTFSVGKGEPTDAQDVKITVEHIPGPTSLESCLEDANESALGNRLPIVGATVSLLDTELSTESGSDGCFLLKNIADSAVVLDINTGTAESGPGGARYASFREAVILIENTTNVIERPIYLPRIDQASLTRVNPDEMTMVENLNLSVTLAVDKHTAKGGDKKDYTGELSISEVPRNRAPVNLPDELDPGLLLTIQPTGVSFAQPAKLTVPNTDNLKLGTELNLWSVDPKKGRFDVVGKGRVEETTEGKTVIKTVSGGIKAAGWHAFLPVISDLSDLIDFLNTDCNCRGQVEGGSTTNITTGNLSVDHTLASYRSLDQTRALRFVYNSQTANAQPIIKSSTTIVSRSAVPDSLSTKLSVGGAALPNEVYTGVGGLDETKDEVITQGLWFTARNYSTGMYPYKLTTTSHFGSTSVSASVSGRVLVHNEIKSPFGAGWGLDGHHRLLENFDKSVLLVDGRGATLIFTPKVKVLGIDTGTPWKYSVVRSLENVDFTMVAVKDFAMVDLFQFDVLLVSETFQDGSVSLASTATLNALNDRSDDIEKFLRSGRGVVAFSEPIGAGAYQWLPDFARPRTDGSNGYNDNVKITEPTHPVLINVDQSGLSGWGASVHGQFRDVGSLTPIVTDDKGNPVTLVGTFGRGNMVVTLQDPDFHYQGINSRTQRDFVRDAIIFASGNRNSGKAFIPPAGDFSKLDRNDDGTFTRTLKNGTSVQFDEDGLQLSEVDSNGNEIRYSYDPKGLLINITDPAGLVTTLEYLGGRLSKISDPTTRATLFEHDAQGNLVRITDPDNTRREFQYDSLNQMASQTSKRGHKTEYEHNPFAQHLKSTLPDGSTREIKPINLKVIELVAVSAGTEANPAPVVRPDELVGTFTDGNGNKTEIRTNKFGSTLKIVDPLDRTVSFNRNVNNLITRVVSPLKRVTTLAYDKRGNLTVLEEASSDPLQRRTAFGYETGCNHVTTVKDPANNTTQFNYDGRCNLTQVSDPLGNKSAFAYDNRGLLLSSTGQNGNTTEFTYDRKGNLETVIDPAGTITKFIRDGVGNVVEVIEGLGTPEQRSRESTYDQMNRILTATDGMGATTAVLYDEDGNPVEIQSPTKEIRKNFYDELGRIIRIEDPITGRTTTEYDVNGNLILSTNSQGIPTRFFYDDADRLVRTVEGLDFPVLQHSFDYDTHDNLITLTDARFQTTRFEYDLLDRQTKQTNPLELATTFGYDLRDNLVRQVNPNGNEITNKYDSLSRLTAIETPDDLGIMFSYDGVGNVTAVQDDDSRVAFTYDSLNRVGQAIMSDLGVQPAITLTHTYDSVGNRTVLEDSEGGVTEFAFDDADQLTRLTTPSAATIDLDYDPAGRLKEILFPNSVVSAYEYDAQGRIDSISHNRAAMAFASFKYAYNTLGNITQIKELTRTLEFEYDSFQRLIRGGTTAAPEEYRYDQGGNRLASHLSASYSHDAANRLLENDAFTYDYDANGNLTTKTGKFDGSATTYSYDGLNRLTSIDFPGGSTATYRYDGLGRRIEKNVDGVISRYVYDGEDILLEYDGTNSLMARYSHGERTDQPLSLERGGRDYFYHADHLGSIRKLTDASGAVVNSYDYDAYGRIENITETVPNSYTYTGREYDTESDLYFYRARYYDPQIGRFITQDPIGLMAGDANLYRYVFNNVTNLTDPSGQFAYFRVLVLIGGVIGGISDDCNWTRGFLKGAVATAVGIRLSIIKLLPSYAVGAGAAFSAEGVGQLFDYAIGNTKDFDLDKLRDETFLGAVTAGWIGTIPALKQQGPNQLRRLEDFFNPDRGIRDLIQLNFKRVLGQEIAGGLVTDNLRDLQTGIRGILNGLR